jgi:predicted Fe-Mo cluster-binding NifX family protein
MNVAVTVWGKRISPVFDSAQTVLVARLQGQEVLERRLWTFPTALLGPFLRLLGELQVEVIICGALCEGQARILENHRIEVISFLTGDVDEILGLFAQGGDLGAYTMPGCRHGRCRRLRAAQQDLLVDEAHNIPLKSGC